MLRVEGEGGLQIESDRLRLRVGGKKKCASRDECKKQSDQDFHGNLRQQFNAKKSTSHK
jgi:hypothetical protein